MLPTFFRTSLLVFIAFQGFLSAADYSGDEVKVTLKRSGKDLTRESVMEETLSAQTYRVTRELEFVDEQIFRFNGVAPDGSTGNWHGFFEAPEHQKPLRLAQAIKGLDLFIAQQLVTESVFQTRPNSWSDFETRVLNADIAFKDGFSFEVLNRYQIENMKNLGYYSENSTSESDSVMRIRKKRREDKLVTREFEVRIVNAPLLDREREQFHLSFDGFTDYLVWDSQVVQYKVKRKQASENRVVYTLTGSRKHTVPVNSLRLKPALKAVGGNLSFDVIDLRFDADVASQCERKVVGTVYEHRNFWNKRELAQFEHRLSSRDAKTTVTDTQLPVPSKTLLLIAYRLQYSGPDCPFFGPDLSFEKVEEVKY